MSYFDELLSKWKELFRMSVAENEHLMLPLFHSFLGIINPVCYLFAGRYNSTRIHTFIIQPSRTGKSEAMKALEFLIKGVKNTMKPNFSTLLYHPNKSLYLTRATEAGLLGSIDVDRSGNTKLIYGALKDSNLICADEGSVLFSDQTFYKDVRDSLNMAMDESGQGMGWVCKRLKNGEISYPSPSTIIAGSYLSDKMKTSVLREGFFQRMFVSYRNFTEEETKGMLEKILELFSVSFQDKENIIGEIKRIKEEWESKIIGKYMPVGSNVPHIKIDENDLKSKFMPEIKAVWDREIAQTFSDNKQYVLNSYSVDELINKAVKIATQKAVFELKDKVTIEDYKYGLDVCKINLDSVKSLLAEFGDTSVKSAEIQREDILIKIIKGRARVAKTELDSIVKRLREEGSWDLGENGTTTLLDSLAVTGKIKKGYQGLEGGGKEVIYST